MNKDQKAQYIDDLAQDLSQANIVYLADTADLSVDKINQFRRRCFQAGITLRVVKNTLLAKAMERVEGRDYGQLPTVLAGPTSVMFAEVGNAPAKLIQEFRKKNDKPLLKGAYIEEAIFIGDNQLDMLVAIKSREELVGDIIGLLQSPAKNVISGLMGGGQKIAGILKTLEERA
jgi:large subunit ribosomal protein L10